MPDIYYQKFAQILVDHSAKVKPGDRVAITATTVAEPAVRELYNLVLERGGTPHILFDMQDQEEAFFAHAREDQLDIVPVFQKIAFEEFDVLFKLRSETDTRSLSHVDPARQVRRQKAMSVLIAAQMRRGADHSLRWMSTLFPTHAYAMEAGMGYDEYRDFFYRACHATPATPDPVAYWQGVERDQRGIINRIEGHDQVALRGPNVDLTLSIQGRKFKNAAGINNLPDGEIYTGPVENSVNGWVHFTYPTVYQGRVVKGVELTFENGKVVQAAAQEKQDFLLQQLDSDAGARYLGEFAIGTNFEINRFTGNILLDEKIGGSFHMALGAGYPETGSTNKSIIHWDMICDMRQDSEILVDGEVVYRDGQFVD